MGVKHRSAIALGGPNLNQSSWWDSGESLPFAAFSNTTTATILPLSIVFENTSSSVSGQETLRAGEAILRLQGGLIAFAVIGTSGGVAASSISTLGIAVYRSFGTLLANITNAGGALTSLSLAAPLTTPMPSGQTFNITVAAGGTSQVWTTSAAVAVGATSIPVSSQTPGTTYAAGQPLVGQLGNMILYGWLSSGSGTPAFPQNASVLMPAITANTALNANADPYGSFALLVPGDVVALYGLTSSSSFSVPAGIVTTMGV